jgi:hypothetical protein
MVADGGSGSPALDCVEISTDAPYYLYVKRDMRLHGGGTQTLHIPHSSVAYIVCYADNGPKPLGFLQNG